MQFEEIDYEVADRILTITLDRPEQLNAMTPVMGEELVAAFDAADADDSVRAIILTGRGRGFCAGADLSRGPNAFARNADRPVGEHRDEGGLVTLRMFDCMKPIIAAVNGPAVGFGAAVTLAADIRMASDQARFGFVHARRGIVMEAASSWFLPRIVGIGQATEWVFSGRVFGADEALAGGLIRSVHAHGELLAAARTLAHEIADNTSALSVALSRQMMWKLLGADHPMEGHKLDSRGVDALGRLSDSKEGVASFLDRRLPKFTLRPSQDMPDFYPWWTPRKFE